MKTRRIQPQAKLTLFSHMVEEVVRNLEVLLENTAATEFTIEGDHLQSRNFQGKLGERYMKYHLGVTARLPRRTAEWFCEVYRCATTRNLGHTWTLEFRETETRTGMIVYACDGEVYRYDIPKE